MNILRCWWWWLWDMNFCSKYFYFWRIVVFFFVLFDYTIVNKNSAESNLFNCIIKFPDFLMIVLVDLLEYIHQSEVLIFTWQTRSRRFIKDGGQTLDLRIDIIFFIFDEFIFCFLFGWCYLTSFVISVYFLYSWLICWNISIDLHLFFSYHPSVLLLRGCDFRCILGRRHRTRFSPKRHGFSVVDRELMFDRCDINIPSTKIFF